MKARRRTAALLEVLGVYVAGQLVTERLIRVLGVPAVNPLESFTAGITNSELIHPYYFNGSLPARIFHWRRVSAWS
jgi:hypothetical protein